MTLLLDTLKGLSHDSELFYDYIIELGQDLDDLSEIRTPENFVDGCQSAVWVAYIDDKFVVDSDAFLVKGVARIITEEANSMDNPANLSLNTFSDITKFLTTQRQRGMQAIVNKIRQISEAI